MKYLDFDSLIFYLFIMNIFNIFSYSFDLLFTGINIISTNLIPFVGNSVFFTGLFSGIFTSFCGSYFYSWWSGSNKSNNLVNSSTSPVPDIVPLPDSPRDFADSSTSPIPVLSQNATVQTQEEVVLHSDHQTALDNLNSQLVSLQSRYDQLLINLKSQSGENKDLSLQLNELINQISALEADFATLKENSNIRIAELTSELDEQSSIMSDLTARNDQYFQRKEILKKEVQELRLEVAKYADNRVDKEIITTPPYVDVDVLAIPSVQDAEVNTQEDVILQLDHDNALDNLNSQLNSLQSSYDQVCENLRSKDDENLSLQREEAKLSQEIIDLTTDIINLQAETTRLNSEIVEKNSDILSLTNQIDALHQDILNLQNNVARFVDNRVDVDVNTINTGIDVGVGNENPMPQFVDAATDPMAEVVLQSDHHTEMETLDSNHVAHHNVLTQELVNSELQKIKILTQIQDLKLEHMDALHALISQLDAVKDEHIKALLDLEEDKDLILGLQDSISSKDRDISNLQTTISKLTEDLALLQDNRVDAEIDATIPTQDAATDPIQDVVTASELDAVIQGIEALEGDAMDRNAAMASQTAQIAADLDNGTSTDLSTFL